MYKDINMPGIESQNLETFAKLNVRYTVEQFCGLFPDPILLVGRHTEDDASAFGTLGPEDDVNNPRTPAADPEEGGHEQVHFVRKTDDNTFANMITIGRSTNNDIVISHPSVSKLHSYFKFDESKKNFTVSDAGSSNGTFIEGFPLPLNKPVSIESGQSIMFGKTIEATFYKPEGFHSFLTQRFGG
jgi:hypothetical protein